jgi:DNA-binding response OmpR family regulator
MASRIQILIAEDSPTQAKQLERILQERGFEVQVARNGQEALDYLLELSKDPQVWENHRPAMLISDIIMPQLTGCDLCHRIKTDERLKCLPVILLTSLTDSREALRGLYSGADDLISKPYEPPFLLARVDDILATLQLTQGAHPDKLMPITMDGQKYFVSAQRLGIINLILTTYEMAVQKNLQLAKAEDTVRQQGKEIETLQLTLNQMADELEALKNR